MLTVTARTPGGFEAASAYRAVLTDSDRFPFADDDRSRLTAAGVRLVEVPGHAPDQVADAVADADAVFVYSATIGPELLARFGSCRLILRCGSGYDGIDVAAARALGVEVAYAPAYGTVDVAEHALALMFTVARRLVELDQVVRGGQWPAYAAIGTMHRLAGSRLGLVGFGRIAQHAATVAKAVGMAVQAYDPYVDADTFDELGVTSTDLAGVAETSDVVSLHLPLTPATHSIIDTTFLAAMKRGSILINTSRGELVDEVALAVALQQRRLAGAGLDVLVDEPPGADHPLVGLPGVVISPHSAAFTDEALAAVRSAAVDELLRFVAGRPFLHPVPTPTAKEAGY